MWVAKVAAPQGGPILTHEFEGADPADLLAAINDALDLSRADCVAIHMEPAGDDERHLAHVDAGDGMGSAQVCYCPIGASH